MGNLTNAINTLLQLSDEEKEALIKALATAEGIPVQEDKKEEDPPKLKRPPKKTTAKKASANKKTTTRKKAAPETSRRRAPKVQDPDPKSTNEFVNSDVFNQCMDDVDIDKKLWGNKKPYRDSDRQSDIIDVKCQKCGDVKAVKSSLVFRMPNGEYSFTCNRCSGGRR